MKMLTKTKLQGKTDRVNTLVRLDREVKKRAQEAARSIDIPLSSIVNNYLNYFSTHKEIAFEYPSPHLIRMIEEAKEDMRKGNVSPVFSNVDDMMKWLNKK